MVLYWAKLVKVMSETKLLSKSMVFNMMVRALAPVYMNS